MLTNPLVDYPYDLAGLRTQRAMNNFTETTFAYDAAHNRERMVKEGVTSDYTYNAANQLTGFTEGARTVAYTYDPNGNRATRTGGAATDTYTYDYENRLANLLKLSAGGPGAYAWSYDYRTRCVELTTPAAPLTKIVFSGGTSVREFESGVPTVDYVRGSDWGGGVGGILYSLRAGVPSFTHYNRRGDVTAKTSAAGALTYQATYEAYGQRVTETGATPDRQKSNTKDEDIPGFANEGFRFRDLETGAFTTKDPAGFVDGPNLYAYVMQNPWTKFDPDGLKVKVEKKERQNKDGTTTKVTNVTVTGKVQFTGESAKRTQKEQKKIVDKMSKTIKSTYESANEPGFEVNVTVDLKISKNAGDIKADDHVIRIYDHLAAGAAGESNMNEKSINLLNSHLDKLGGKHAAHELGHTMGLWHPNPADSNNTKKDLEKGNLREQNPLHNLEPSNVMRYFGKQNTVNSAQIESINETNINRGSNQNTMTGTNN